jgi:hypothetical protein
MEVRMPSVAKSVAAVFAFSAVLLALPVSAGESENAAVAACAAKTGGQAQAFAACVSGSLASAEVDKLFQGKAFGCGNDIRKLLRINMSKCEKDKQNELPKLILIMPFREGFIVGYDSKSLYHSPDGENLRGGGQTKLVYNAGQQVLLMMPYKNGVLSAFDGGGIYFSPDGQNLGGGGKTQLLYAGQRVVSMTGRDGGVETCFSGGGCYFSPDGSNPGGGGETKRTK